MTVRMRGHWETILCSACDWRQDSTVYPGSEVELFPDLSGDLPPDTQQTRVEAELFAHGMQLGDYFLVDGMPMFWGELGDARMPWAVVIEDDVLAQACVEYLRRHGVKEYTNIGEISEPSDQ